MTQPDEVVATTFAIGEFRGTPLPVSCFIIAKNEADRIARTIRSVAGLVSEIVVVDGESTDKTVEIAQAEGAKVVVNRWPGFGQQKRFAEDQCRHDWLLNIDADEVVTPALAEEIRSLFSTGPPRLAAYGMPDLVIYPGKSRPRPFARDHFFYRLYDRRRVRFANETLFDNVALGREKAGVLKSPLHHYSVRSFDDLIAKCDTRATYNAAHAKKKPAWLLKLRLVTEFPVNFLKYYFIRTHVTGGLDGFQYATILAFYRFVRIVRMLQNNRVAQGEGASAGTHGITGRR